jgi:sulfonate dioxygenase
VGYKKEESDAFLNFLYDHIAFGADFQARVQWKKGDVIFWDASTPLLCQQAR